MIAHPRSSDRRFGLACLATVVLGLTSLCAQDEKTADDEAAALKAKAATLAGQIDLQSLKNGEWADVARLEGSVLSYGDPTRSNSNGSVWVWGEAGRPLAIMELYQPATRPDDWVYVLCNISGGDLRANRNEQSWWSVNSSDIATNPLEGAPAVGATRGPRLLQMKEISRRFEAHEFWDPNNSRFELRLLAQPLHRYADEDRGVVDGSVFAFTNGTNPEVLLLVEAKKDGEALAWNYSLARLGHAEMHVTLDGHEIWTVARVDAAPPTEPYFLHYETITNLP